MDLCDNKKVKFLIILFLFSSLSYSQETINKEAKKLTPLSKEDIKLYSKQDLSGVCIGTTPALSLFDSGRSLHGVSQQDQDGLATCYANTSSLIIKSYNPSLPVPSYLDIAAHNPDYQDEVEKNYEFNYGLTCESLNEVKKKGGVLCVNGILENQSTGIQDNILYKLHNVINKYGYGQEDMTNVLRVYDEYLAENPRPVKQSCEDTGVDYTRYINSVVSGLASSYNYETTEDYEYSAEDKAQAEACSYAMKEVLVEKNIWVKTITEDEKNHYGEYMLNKNTLAKLNYEYEKQMKSNRFKNNKTYHQRLVELLDSQPTVNATYEYVLGYNINSQNKQFTQQLNDIAQNVDQLIFKDFFESIKNSNAKTKSCFDRKRPYESNGGLFFNSILGECFRDISQWRIDIWDATQQCSDGDRELLEVFKTLTALGTDIDDMNKFIVKKDQNVLKQIIDNNCEKKHTYALPSNKCEYMYVPSGLGNLSDPEQWKFYKMFEDDIAAYIKNGGEDPIDLNNFVTYLIQKLDERGYGFGSTYRNFLNETFANFKKLDNTKEAKTSFLAKAKNVVSNYKQTKINSAKKIYQSIREGHALGVSTCGSLFSSNSKDHFEDCNNHAVTATGVKCVDGRLKIELTNSWGIGCTDNKSSLNLVTCQRDQDGLTNGRAWVDFEYLSNQAMRIRSF